MDDHEINDKRTNNEFKGISFSGYKKGDVVKTLLKSINDNKIEEYINCLSLNSNVNLKEEVKHIKNNFCFQGNLDPYLLVEGGDIMIKEINNILTKMKNNFFIFNSI